MNSTLYHLLHNMAVNVHGATDNLEGNATLFCTHALQSAVLVLPRSGKGVACLQSTMNLQSYSYSS